MRVVVQPARCDKMRIFHPQFGGALVHHPRKRLLAARDAHSGRVGSVVARRQHHPIGERRKRHTVADAQPHRRPFDTDCIRVHGEPFVLAVLFQRQQRAHDLCRRSHRQTRVGVFSKQHAPGRGVEYDGRFGFCVKTKRVGNRLRDRRRGVEGAHICQAHAYKQRRECRQQKDRPFQHHITRTWNLPPHPQRMFQTASEFRYRSFYAARAHEITPCFPRRPLRYAHGALFYPVWQTARRTYRPSPAPW